MLTFFGGMQSITPVGPEPPILPKDREVAAAEAVKQTKS